jgi:NADPH:quinone reductase
MGILEAAVLTAGDVVLVTGPRAASAICWCRRRWPPGQPSSAPLVAPRRARPSGFGALHVVDSGDPLWPTTARDELGDRGITVVLDGVGGDIATAAMNVLVPGGRLVMFGWASGVPARLGALQQAALDAVASGRWVPLIGPRSRWPTRPPPRPRWSGVAPSAKPCCIPEWRQDRRTATVGR